MPHDPWTASPKEGQSELKLPRDLVEKVWEAIAAMPATMTFDLRQSDPEIDPEILLRW